MIADSVADGEVESDRAHGPAGAKTGLFPKLSEAALGSGLALIDRSTRHPPALEVAVAHEEHLPVFPLGKDAGAQAHRRHGPHPSGTDAVGGTKQEVCQRHETSGLAAA